MSTTTGTKSLFLMLQGQEAQGPRRAKLHKMALSGTEDEAAKVNIIRRIFWQVRRQRGSAAGFHMASSGGMAAGQSMACLAEHLEALKITCFFVSDRQHDTDDDRVEVTPEETNLRRADHGHEVSSQSRRKHCGNGRRRSAAARWSARRHGESIRQFRSARVRCSRLTGGSAARE